MKLPQRHRDGGSPVELNMTPMIDVVFQLLIFFICTANFQVVEQDLLANRSAPASAGAAVDFDPSLAELEEVVVRVGSRDGRLTWAVGDRPCADLREVELVLRQLVTIRADLDVIVDVDGDVPLGGAVDVYDLCLVVGLARDKVRFAAPKPS